MCGQLTAYNTYATLSYTKPLFLGFSCYQNVNKEIITKNIKRTSKPLEIQYFQGFSLCLHFRKKIYKYRKPLIHGKRSIGGTLVDLPIFLDN